MLMPLLKLFVGKNIYVFMYHIFCNLLLTRFKGCLLSSAKPVKILNTE